MVVIYARDEVGAQRVRNALPDRFRPVYTDAWSHFERLVGRGTCAVVVATDLSAPGILDRLRQARRRLPPRPLILVTASEIANVRHLKDVDVDEVVFTSEIDTELVPALDRAGHQAFLRSFSHALKEADHVSRVVASALEIACTREVPLRSVADLAEIVDRDRRTLWYHWREAVDDGPGIKTVLDWILLVRAASQKGAAVSWAGVARQLDVPPQALRRLSSRLLERSLTELEPESWELVADGFDRNVLRPLGMRREGRTVELVGA